MSLEKNTEQIIEVIGTFSECKDLDQLIDATIKLFSYISGIVSMNIHFNMAIFGFTGSRKHLYIEKEDDVEYISKVIQLKDVEGYFGEITLCMKKENNLSAFPIFARVAPELISELYKGFWLSSVLTTITAPIEFDEPPAKYIRLLCEMGADASGARYVVIRDLVAGSFPCTGFYDRENPSNYEKIIDITETETSELFNYLQNFLDQAKNKSYNDISILNNNGPTFTIIRELFSDNTLISVVTAPLMRGGEATGIISFLFDSKVIPSKFIRNSFLLLANHTAVTLENYRQSKRNVELMAISNRKSIEKVNFEIIQGLRHSAFNNISKLRTQFAISKELFPQETYQRFENALLDVTKDLESMRSLTGKSEQSMEFICINDCFNEAVEILSNRLHDPNVKIKIDQKREYILGNQSAITTAFINIILNSLDSFKEGRKGADRVITLNIVNSRIDRIEFDVSDNGIGFRPHGKTHDVDQIWETGITTRKEGTGHGLPYIREVFQNIHSRGTVKIHNFQNGFTLRIQIFRYSEGSKKQFEDRLKKLRG